MISKSGTCEATPCKAGVHKGTWSACCMARDVEGVGAGEQGVIRTFLLLIFGSIKLQKKIGSITLQWLQINGSNHTRRPRYSSGCRRGDSNPHARAGTTP